MVQTGSDTRGNNHGGSSPVIGTSVCNLDILPRQSRRNRSGHHHGSCHSRAIGKAARSSPEHTVTIRLYFDEDSMQHALVNALRARGINVLTALEGTASDNPSQEVSGRAPRHHCVGKAWASDSANA